MPDYISIANSQVDPESPVTAELMTALRDNPLAIADGDPTAPRVSSKGLGLIRAFDNNVNTNAGGNAIINIGLGDSRQQVVIAQCSITNYGTIVAGGGDFESVAVGDRTILSEGTGTLETGDSDIFLQGSNDTSTWTNLATIASYTYTPGGGGATAEVITRSHVYWNGTGIAGEYGAASYRYYRIFATGDGDHVVQGNFALLALGD